MVRPEVPFVMGASRHIAECPIIGPPTIMFALWGGVNGKFDNGVPMATM